MGGAGLDMEVSGILVFLLLVVQMVNSVGSEASAVRNIDIKLVLADKDANKVTIKFIRTAITEDTIVEY